MTATAIEAIALAIALPALAEPAAPRALEGVDIVEHLGETVPAGARFYDTSGKEVRLGDLVRQGKPTLLTLVYYDCPMLCSLVLSGLVRGMKALDYQLGRDYQAITISFDPKDTPRRSLESQRGNLESLGHPEADAAWPFLVGDADEIAKVSEAVGFKYRYDASVKQYAHPAAVFVLSPEGKLTRYLYGVEFAPKDLKLALTEAGEGRVGTSVDRAILQCYRYDPASRRYRLFVSTFLRGGGLLIFGAVALLLAGLWRRERRAAALEPREAQP